MRVPAVLILSVTLLAVPAAVLAKGAPKYADDLEAFFDHADKNYPFFDLKKIRKDWGRTKKDLAKRVRSCRSDEDFIFLVYDAVRCLRDGHMGVRAASVKLDWPKRYYPGIGFLPAADDRVIVMHAPPGREATVKPGMVVTKIDGQPARKFLEARAGESWEEGGFFSSPQRARLFVYRTPFAGEKGEKHEIAYLDGKKEKELTLRSDREISGWPHTYNLPEGLAREGRSFFHASLPSGVGYMYWRRIDASVWGGIPKALAAHPDVKGWIVDLRGNGGGGYGRELLDQMKALPRPVAVITDAGCISAGETSVRDLVNLAEARVFGARTAGSSTSKAEWAFPSGIAKVLFSTRSRGGLGGKPIEYNGIEPHEVVEPVPEEVLAGKNSEILRAEEWVLTEAGKK
jgi:hypothetical protein